MREHRFSHFNLQLLRVRLTLETLFLCIKHWFLVLSEYHIPSYWARINRKKGLLQFFISFFPPLGWYVVVRLWNCFHLINKKKTLLQLKGDYFPNYLHRGSFTVWVLHLQNRSSVSKHTEAVDWLSEKKEKKKDKNTITNWNIILYSVKVFNINKSTFPIVHKSVLHHVIKNIQVYLL